MRVYLDVNVVIDYLLGRSTFGLEALQVLTLAKEGEIEVFAAPNTFVIGFYKIHQELKDAKKAKHILAMLRKTLNCVTMDDAILDAALKQPIPKDLEDGVQLEAALAVKADVFLTNDRKLLKIKRVKVQTPTEFLSEYELK